MLIYCSSEFKDELLQKFELAAIVSEDIDLQTLRSLDEHSGGKFKLLITDEATMGLRGLDYRSYD